MVDLSPRTLQGYERGLRAPSAEVLSALAMALGFPVSFFSREPILPPEQRRVSFRSRKSMSATRRDSARAMAAIGAEVYEWIEGRYNLPKASLPAVPIGLGPEAAADFVRHAWGMGSSPVSNAVHMLEFFGVRVLSLPEEHADLDGISFWRKDRPYVFLDTSKTPERGRFDAVHELGHLVCHRSTEPLCEDSQATEREADRFASAFLMPRETLAAAAGASSLGELIQLKSNWGVALSALAYRLREVGYLTEWAYRGLCIEIAQHGYRRREPDGMARESSQVLEQVLRDLRSKGITRREIATECCISPEELDGYFFGMTMFTVEGGGAGGGRGFAPKLQVVSGAGS